MLHWSAVFFVAALVVGILVPGGVSAVAAEIATAPFFVFLALLALAAVFGRRILSLPFVFRPLRHFHKTEGDGVSPPHGATAPTATTKTRLT